MVGPRSFTSGRRGVHADQQQRVSRYPSAICRASEPSPRRLGHRDLPRSARKARLRHGRWCRNRFAYSVSVTHDHR